MSNEKFTCYKCGKDFTTGLWRYELKKFPCSASNPEKSDICDPCFKMHTESMLNFPKGKYRITG